MACITQTMTINEAWYFLSNFIIPVHPGVLFKIGYVLYKGFCIDQYAFSSQKREKMMVVNTGVFIFDFKDFLILLSLR